MNMDNENKCDAEQAPYSSTAKWKRSSKQDYEKEMALSNFSTRADLYEVGSKTAGDCKGSEDEQDVGVQKDNIDTSTCDVGQEHNVDTKPEDTHSVDESETHGALGDCDEKHVEDLSETVPCVNKDDQDTAAADSGEEHEVDIEIEKVKAPDGGWGWMIVLGAILLRCMTGGVVRSRGILFIKFRDRFHGSATSTALLTSLSAFLRLAVSPSVSILTNRFECRNLQAVGVVIMATGLIATAYMPSQSWLYFTFSILGGFGRAFILAPVPILLSSYFDKRRSRAFGLASAGRSLGGFALVPVVELLFQTYGFQGAFLILGGFILQIFVFISLFRPVELHRKLIAKRDSEHGVGTTEMLVLKGKESLHVEEDHGLAAISLKNERSPETNTSNTNTDTPCLKSLDEKNSLEGSGYATTNYAANTVIANGKINAKQQQIEHLLDHASDMTESRISPNNSRKSSATKSKTNPKKAESKAGARNGRMSSAKKSDSNLGKKKKKLIDLTILKDVRYVCYVVATMCFSLPSTGLFLPSLAKARGISEIQAASLLSVTAGVDFVSRTMTGFVLDLKVFRHIRPEIYNGVLFLQCVVMALYPSMRTFQQFAALCAVTGMLRGIKNAQIYTGVTFLQCVVMTLFPSIGTFQQFAALCAVNGMLRGIKNAQVTNNMHHVTCTLPAVHVSREKQALSQNNAGSVIVMDMLGMDKLASSQAVTMTAQGISVLLGPAISGRLVDKYETYDGVYYFGTCAIFTGACIMAFGHIRKRCMDNTKRTKGDNSTPEVT